MKIFNIIFKTIFGIIKIFFGLIIICLIDISRQIR